MIPKQDRLKPRTVEDLERMYNLRGSMEKVKEHDEAAKKGIINAKTGSIGDWKLGKPSEIADLYSGTALYSKTYSNGEETGIYLTPDRVYITIRNDQESMVDYASWADIIRVVNNSK